MTMLLIYQNAVALDRDYHRQLKLKATDNAGFAAAAHAVPLVAVEFGEAAHEYPIVFARGAAADGKPGELLCYALTGTREGENLYLDAAGRWDADYVPAFIRRYPFVFAETGADQLTVCIDQSFSGFNETDGEPLFDDTGDPAPLLKGALELLTDYQQQVQRTGAFLRKLDAADILTPTQLQADFPDGRHALVQGMLVVDETRLKQLPPATVQEWFASGELDLIYAHLLSLGNLKRLAQRMPEMQPIAVQQPPAAAATPERTAE
jgi:hypothetical protein